MTTNVYAPKKRATKRVKTAKADLEKYESCLARVKQNLDVAKRSFSTVKKEKQTFTQAVAK